MRLTTSLAGLGLVALLVSPPLFAEGATARTISTEFGVTIGSFPVGKARLQVEFDKSRYSIGFSGRSSGIARLFTDAETSAAASGAIDARGLQPVDYSHVWTEDHENETVSMHFQGGALSDVKLDPPRRHPERYVPLTPENMAGAVDPVSAFLWPAFGGVDESLCARTLPLFDGKRRFDISFAFSRFATFTTSDRSFSGRAVVCSFRYRQVAGHRLGKKSGDSIEDAPGMEVWIVSAGDGLGLPVRIQFNTRVGKMLLQATRVTEAD